MIHRYSNKLAHVWRAGGPARRHRREDRGSGAPRSGTARR